MDISIIIKEINEQFKFFLKLFTENNKFPLSYSESNGLLFCDLHHWACSFPTGSMWYLYELTGHDKWKNIAIKSTPKLENAKNRTNTHDLGFIIYCSYGNAYRITKKTEYKSVIIQASNTLIKRFNSNIGSLRSWDFGDWKFPVIIDNIMNLEMLLWASKVTGKSIYKHIAIKHADLTMKNHYRSNFSCFHVIDYDENNGQVIKKLTYQGLNDQSSWARGQAWGFYGYVMLYRETRIDRYLIFAERIASYILDNLPNDMIPCWDFDVDNNNDQLKDASAGSIICSAFYELSEYVPNKNKYYYNIAYMILKSLSSKQYRAEVGTNHGFLLLHSTGNKHENTQIDASISYADYYYLESLKRHIYYKNI